MLRSRRLASAAIAIAAAAALLGSCRDRHDVGQRTGARTGEAAVAQRPRPANATQGPDRDYPTPALAGTDDLFLRGEPLRGPHLTNVALPNRRELRFTEHAFCELTVTRLACGAPRPRSGVASRRWNVGRNAAERAVLAEELGPTGTVMQTVFFDWNAGGRLTRLVSLDAHGVLAWARTFSPPGERYFERNLAGANGLPGCGMLAVKTDGHNRVQETDCLQWNGNPMRDTNGVAITLYRTNGDGFVVEETRLTLDRKPLAGHDGVHRVVYQRADSGRVEAELYYDLVGKPVISAVDGCSGRRHEYDDRGVETRNTCLGKDGEPARREDGVAVTVLQANDAGCLIGQRYLDREGKPTHIHGVYGTNQTVGALCEELASTCIDNQGDPVACGPKEPATFEYERDDKGRVVWMRHRDPDGDPGHDSEYEVFALREEWDALGNLVRKSCWGASGEPVECDHTGYHAEKLRYDDVGRTREVRYFSIEGELASNLGVAIRRYVYDNYDHIHEIDGFDADGNPVETLGMAAQRRLYDSAHRLFAMLLFDREGRPARYTGCFVGRDCPTRDWHAVRLFRGPNGRVTKNEYFDTEGQLIDTMDCDSHRCWQ
jgi:hypothetical protein